MGSKWPSFCTRYGYTITRQSGSHTRLTSSYTGEEHHVTIPEHNPLRIGTISGILGDVANNLKISKDELMAKLFTD